LKVNGRYSNAIQAVHQGITTSIIVELWRTRRFCFYREREVIFQQVCSRFIFVVVVAANASHGKEGIKAIEFI